MILRDRALKTIHIIVANHLSSILKQIGKNTASATLQKNAQVLIPMRPRSKKHKKSLSFTCSMNDSIKPFSLYCVKKDHIERPTSKDKKVSESITEPNKMSDCVFLHVI